MAKPDVNSLDQPIGGPTVTIIMDGGAIQDVVKSCGLIRVVVRDYDIGGYDLEDLPRNDRLKTDDNGTEYIESEW